MQSRRTLFDRSRLSLLAFAPMLLFGMASVDARSGPPAAYHARAKAKRRSVVDYYYLLPTLGIGGVEPRSYYRELLQPKACPIIDLRNDYLQVHPDSSPAKQVAVFRTHNKPDLFADISPDFESDYNGFALYRLNNGKLKNVTDEMLPVPVKMDDYLYELPRKGTTIRVFRFDLQKQQRWHVFDLQWRGGRFVKVP